MTATARVAARRITEECLAGRVRLLSRVISGLYDDALRPHGLTVAQMGILAVIAVRGQCTPADVSGTLCLEKSTLSRNLDRMIRRGWIEVRAGRDGRTHRMRATARGRRLVERAAAAWRAAQGKARALLGEPGAATLRRLHGRVTRRGRR